MSEKSEQELLKRIDRLEQMLKSCKESLDSYQKALNLFITSYTEEKKDEIK